LGLGDENTKHAAHEPLISRGDPCGRPIGRAILGRFHYLPIEVVREKITEAGFVAVEDRVSFAGQAYLVRCKKPQ